MVSNRKFFIFRFFSYICVLIVHFMSSKSLVTLGILGYAAYYLYSRYIVGSGLNFVPRGLNFNGLTATVNIGVQNPSSNALTLNSFVGNLYINGSNFGPVSSFATTVIQPNSETVIPVNVSPNILGIASQTAEIIQNGFDGLTGELKGTANVNGAPLPIDINF